MAEARKENEQAEAIRKRIGATEAEAISKLYLAGLAIEVGQFQQAGSLARQAEEVFQKTKARHLEGYAQALSSQSLLGEGNFSEAQERIGPVIAHSKEFMNFDYRLAVQIIAARVRAASCH